MQQKFIFFYFLYKKQILGVANYQTAKLQIHSDFFLAWHPVSL